MSEILTDRFAIERLKREYFEHHKLIVGFDFDNTVYDYHGQGLDFNPIITLLRQCSELGFTMCLYTVPDAKMSLEAKADYCELLGIKVHWVNQSPVLPNPYKPYFNILLDDRAGLFSAYNCLRIALLELDLI